MKGSLEDLRYGARLMLKNPGFTIAAVLTLALGIGMNTALFTVFDAFVLKPLPLKDPDTIVQIQGVDRRGSRTNLFSYPDYVDYRDANTTLSGLAAMNKVAVTAGDARPEGDDLTVMRDESAYVFGQIVSGNYFEVLGAEMEKGRGFLPEEDRTPGAYPLIVISHKFWQRQFGSDADIIGKTVKLQGQTFSIIGVTRREFIGTTPDAPSFWAPLMMRDQLITAGQWNYRRWFTERNADSFVMVGRLKPGVTLTQAQAEMRSIAQQLAERYPDDDLKVGVTLKGSPGFITLSESDSASLLPLPLAVALVLLIACANVANLLLARAATRQKEIAVRLALGASRWRLIRQLLTESALIATVGGVAGLLLATWALDALYPLVLSRLPIPAALRDSLFVNLGPDYLIFGFTMLISVIAGLVAGLAPALQASRPDLTSALKDEGSTFGHHLSQSNLRSGLVVAQISVSLMLLIGAGLLVRNLQNVKTTDLGLDAKNLFSVAVNLKNTTDQDSQRQLELRRQFSERLRALPGVQSIAQSFRQPLAGRPASTSITVAGREEVDGYPLRANYNFVSPGYFETLGIQLLRGRVFTEQEVSLRAPVIIISESTARFIWPGLKDAGEAIGNSIGIGAGTLNENMVSRAGDRTASDDAINFPSYEVIGVARDTRSGWVWEKDETYIYLPLTSDNPLGEYLLVKTIDDPRNVMAAVRGEAEEFHSRLSVSLQRAADNLDLQVTPFRAVAIVAGVLGLLALLLASIGLYGVMSFIVTRRTREVGIRVALGASPRDIITLFVKQGLQLIAAGIVIGVAGGAVISRLLSSVLLNVSPLDPWAFVGVSLLLAVVALLACYVPARRMIRIHPMEALRHE